MCSPFVDTPQNNTACLCRRYIAKFRAQTLCTFNRLISVKSQLKKKELTRHFANWTDIQNIPIQHPVILNNLLEVRGTGLRCGLFEEIELIVRAKLSQLKLKGLFSYGQEGNVLRPTRRGVRD